MGAVESLGVQLILQPSEKQPRTLDIVAVEGDLRAVVITDGIVIANARDRIEKCRISGDVFLVIGPAYFWVTPSEAKAIREMFPDLRRFE